MKNRLLSIAIILVMLLPLLVLPLSADTEMSGVSIEQSQFYEAEKPFDSHVLTMEAWVKFPSIAAKGAESTIATDFRGYNNSYLFSVTKGGQPQLTYVEAKKTKGTSYIFDSVNINDDTWNHLAIAIDAAEKQAHCYLNGQLMQTIAIDFDPLATPLDHSYMLCNDGRSGKINFCKGEIAFVALYSDMRTGDEVAADYEAATPDSSDLLACYDLSDGGETLEDKSGNGFDMTLKDLWIENKNHLDADEFDFSFAVIGDTQKILNKRPEKYTLIYDWLTDYVYDRKMELVIGLGDITDASTEEEWEKAVEQITRLDGEVRYTLVRGNHDKRHHMDEYFTPDYFSDVLGGTFEPDSIVNSWQEIEVQGIKYLILCLDYEPSDEALEWANKVCEEHPDHNVIVTTHAYMFIDGDRNNIGENIWEKLCSKQENIFLVISGHESSDRIVVRQDEGANGKTVTQMLIDPQTVDEDLTYAGMIAMFYFSNKGRTLTVEYFSSVEDTFFSPESQFTVELDLLGSDASDPTVMIIVIVAVAAVIIAAAVAAVILSKKKKAE